VSAATLSTEGQEQRMPLIIKLPKNSEIEIQGVILKAETACAFSLDDHSFKFIKQTDNAPRRIVPSEATE
jgi:hypothetical protein